MNLIIIYLLCRVALGDLSLLLVSPSNTEINQITTYTWQITFTNSISRTFLELHFPTHSSFTSSTSALQGGVGLSSSNSSSNVIRIVLNPSSLATSFTIVVTDVKNPPFAYTSTNSEISLISDDGPTPQTTSFTSITFSKGAITTCNINFVGETGDQGSTVIDIIPKNPITGSFCLYFAYSTSTTTIIDNGYPQCMISVNGSSYSVQAVQSERITQEIKCLFNDSLVITDGENLQIILSGTTNPFTTDNYGTFTLTTSDSIYEYDQASSCNLGVVALKQYIGTFFFSTSA